jgi:hypothetical protein
VNNLTDSQLLRDYVQHRSEAAFAELVRRHVDLVYSAALRMVRDAHLAEDVTQSAFVALAQNARQLPAGCITPPEILRPKPSAPTSAAGPANRRPLS